MKSRHVFVRSAGAARPAARPAGRPARRARVGTLVATLVAVVASVPCGAAVAELGLDRAAVQDLLAAVVPAALDVELRGVGATTLELGRPRRTDFRDGAVETTIRARLPALGLAGELIVRFRPEIEPLYGTPLLRVVDVRVADPGLPATGLGRAVAATLPPAALPRQADWTVPLGTSDNEALAVTCFVQAVHVGDERLRLDLGLRVAGPRRPLAAARGEAR